MKKQTRLALFAVLAYLSLSLSPVRAGVRIVLVASNESANGTFELYTMSESGADLRRGWEAWSSGTGCWIRADELIKGRHRESYPGENLRRHDERSAEALLVAGWKASGLTWEAVQAMKKSAPEKQALLWLVKTKTAGGDEWVLAKLNAGHRSM